MEKVIQLYETMMTRHSTMIVGPTSGGKTVVINTLIKAQTNMGLPTKCTVLNPKVRMNRICNALRIGSNLEATNVNIRMCRFTPGRSWWVEIYEDALSRWCMALGVAITRGRAQSAMLADDDNDGRMIGCTYSQCNRFVRSSLDGTLL